MKRSLFIIIILHLTYYNLAAQKQKEVIGTFAIGCKVFNYNFKESVTGLCSFRLEDPEHETHLTLFNIDSLKNFIADVKKIDVSADTTISAGLKDSINDLKTKVQDFATALADDSASIDYLNNIADSIKKLIKIAGKINFQNYLPSAPTGFSFSRFSTTLDTAFVNVKSIAENKAYTLNSFEQDPFEQVVTTLLQRRKLLFLNECVVNTEIIGKRASNLFFDIKARLQFADDEPSTAYLKLKNNRIQCYYLEGRNIRNLKNGKSKQKLISKKFLVDDVTVEFEDGTIKNIFVDMRVDDSNHLSDYNLPLRFKNVFPISISSRTDPDMFDKFRIFVGKFRDLSKYYEVQTDTVDSSFKKITYNPFHNKKDIEATIYFYLSDLLEYYVIADNNREDYSPVNSTVHLNKNIPSLELRKEKRSKILTVQAYTDFMGIENEQPNGVIQVEACKRINLITNKSGTRNTYTSALAYLEPVLAFTKIEKNKNALPLNFTDIDSTALKDGKKSLFTQAINLYRYQKSSFDLNLNIAKLNLTEMKSTFHLNLKGGIMKSNISDSVSVIGNNQAVKSQSENITVVNTFRWGSVLIWEIKPENRYGVTLGWDFRILKLLNETYITLIKTPVLHTIWAHAFLKTNEENRLFFRYRMTFDNTYTKKNYTEIQLGYQMDLFKSSK